MKYPKLTRFYHVLFCLFSCCCGSVPQQFLGIPGTTQTKNGYDNEFGNDAICWGSKAGRQSSDLMPFPNPLIPDYQMSGAVELFEECPLNNTLEATAPVEFERGERLRTGRWYNYHVTATLNLASLNATEFVSYVIDPHNGTVVFNGTNRVHMVSVQVIACVVGIGFCSPFIHEQANARLALSNLTASTPLGNLHGGSHVHSPFVVVSLLPDDGPSYYIDIDVPMLVNAEGSYFVIASIQMMVANVSYNDDLRDALLFSEPDMRYDMADALSLVHSSRLISYQDPPIILEVSQGGEIASYVAIAIVGSIELALLVETARNRNHQVCQLTQGHFLMVFLAATLVATASSFLLQPKNDYYCQAGLPLVLVSLQLSFSITMGRLWRINAIISPILRLAVEKQDDILSNVLKRLWTIFGICKGATIRKQVSATHLAAVVTILTIPQVVLQILAITLQPSYRTIQYNADESVGRAICTSNVRVAANLTYYGLFFFLSTVAAMLAMAYTARNLPSLFNETRIIFDASISSVMMLILGFIVIRITNSPTMSPAIEYTVKIFLVLTISLQSSMRIMMPKLKLIWRNEVIVVSKLLSSHSDFSLSTRSETVRDGHTVISGRNNSNFSKNDIILRTSMDDTSSHIDFVNTTIVPSNTQKSNGNDANVLTITNECTAIDTDMLEEGADETDSHEGRERVNIHLTASQELVFEMPLSTTPTNSRAIDDMTPSRQRSIVRRIIIKRNSTPSQTLLLKMLNLQNLLTRVNEKIMSGLTVSEQQWEVLRDTASNLGYIFTSDVHFDWETSQDLVDTHEKENLITI